MLPREARPALVDVVEAPSAEARRWIDSSVERISFAARTWATVSVASLACIVPRKRNACSRRASRIMRSVSAIDSDSLPGRTHALGVPRLTLSRATRSRIVAAGMLTDSPTSGAPSMSACRISGVLAPWQSADQMASSTPAGYF